MRLNLRLTNSAEALVANLLERSPNLKPKDLLLDSLALLHLAVVETEKNGQLGFKDAEGNFTAITTPTLSALIHTRTSQTQSVSAADEAA